MITKSQKLYLYAIYKLRQSGKTVRSVDVARIVGVSKPSTVSMMQKLAEDGYITKEPYREIELTDKGVKVANELYTPGIILSDFFIRKLGISEKQSDEDTITFISHLSDETIEKMINFIIEKT